MKKIAVIPARYAATRFPGKLMHKIGDKTIIAMVYENAVGTGLFDEVIVATDSDVIMEEIAGLGGVVKKSKKEHQSGSDRIAEAIEELDVDVIVNIQGDEPFIKREPLEKLINCFLDAEVQVASLMKKFDQDEEPQNPNLVKVICDDQQNALYFSRSVIPYKRNNASPLPYFRHIGVYAFRKQALIDFTRWPAGALEQAELLEQLRYLERGIKIRMVETDSVSIGIDTPEDLYRARTAYPR